MTRLISGVAGGRRLKVPRTGVRPTGDRAREALFNSLKTLVDLHGASVLDLYAGSGALGLEALSRGASTVVLVENSPGVLPVLRENLAAVGLPGARIVAGSVPTVVGGAPPARFDLVLADPPYATPSEEVQRRAPVARRAGMARARGRRRRRALEPGRALRVADTAGRSARPAVRRGPAPVRSLLVRRAVCPGSFDPVTNGHVDVITRAAGLYDELVVAVLVNPGKAGLFSVDERMDLLRDAVADLPNVVVDSFQGLLVDYCRTHDIPVIVKGLRAVSDFEYELQMAQMNRELAAVETLFVPTAPAGRAPLLEPGQADRHVRRRRLPARPEGRARAAAGAPRRAGRGAPHDRGRLPALRDRRRADDGHRERPQRSDVGLLHGAARPPARPARRPA